MHLADRADGGGGPDHSMPPSYYYLWHLAAINVLEAEFGSAPVSEGGLPAGVAPNIKRTVWDMIGEAHPHTFASATVALIDVGVSRFHPNLRSRIDDRSIDFASHPYGAQTELCKTSGDVYKREEKQAFFEDLDVSDLVEKLLLNPDETAFLDSFVAELILSEGVKRQLPEGDETFGSHGTAVAGLVVGEPAIVVQPKTDLPPMEVGPLELVTEEFDSLSINPHRALLPYFGVDPFSRLLSIKTSFESDPEQFLAAFLYAWKCRVDVILLPRGLPDPIRGVILPKKELREDLDKRINKAIADLYVRLDESASLSSEIDPHQLAPSANPDLAWSVLEKLILAVSLDIPVVCAAGNDGESQLIYPARLAGNSGSGVIAVGAVTPKGHRSGYSNYGDGLTLVAPADDSQVYNRHQLRIDKSRQKSITHFDDFPEDKKIPFSPYALLTTDLPGAFGYQTGSEPYSLFLPPDAQAGTGAGYYTLFGGTSGASALVAGVAALVARAYKAKEGAGERLTGPRMKEILSCSSAFGVFAPEGTVLKPDPMNADDEMSVDKKYFFGAGLINAAEAVRMILEE